MYNSYNHCTQNQQHKAMELTLIKSKTFELQPYGRFSIKWNCRQEKPNFIPFLELHINHETSMPMSEEQIKQVVKLMKKNKTDILKDSNSLGFYTRLNDGFVRVTHKKLMMYQNDPLFRDVVDNGRSF